VWLSQEMWPGFFDQQRDQLRLMEGEVIGNIEAHDADVPQRSAKLPREAAMVLAFHYKNDVGPCQLFRLQSMVSIGCEAG
jgi:hypothetical protein